MFLKLSLYADDFSCTNDYYVNMAHVLTYKADPQKRGTVLHIEGAYKLVKEEPGHILEMMKRERPKQKRADDQLEKELFDRIKTYHEACS